MHVGASRRSTTAAVTTFRGELLANDARSLGVLELLATPLKGHLSGTMVFPKRSASRHG